MDYFIVAIPLAVLVAGLLWLLWVPSPKPPPASSFRACFESRDAPPLAFDGRRVQPQASGLAARPYSFVLHKYGTLGIDAKPGLMLRQLPNGRFSFINGRPRFADSTMTLLHQVDGKLYPVFKSDDAQFLEVDSDGGATMRFVRAPVANCGL
ncbi:MAG TPA: hypothetical protein VF079_03640 [Sphingomicrobium sp.]